MNSVPEWREAESGSSTKLKLNWDGGHTGRFITNIKIHLHKQSKKCCIKKKYHTDEANMDIAHDRINKIIIYFILIS